MHEHRCHLFRISIILQQSWLQPVCLYRNRILGIHDEVFSVHGTVGIPQDPEQSVSNLHVSYHDGI